MKSFGRRQSVGRSNRREAGQSMVELALVLPLFLTMVFAIVEIGRAFAAKQSLTIAAREGARVLVLPYGAGLTHQTEASVRTAAVDRVRSYLTSSGVGVGSETTIRVARIGSGNDGVYGSGDDQPPEIDYTQATRGQRVGIIIEHHFESPLPFFVRMFESPASAGVGGGDSPDSSIRMVTTCYMDHE